MTSGYRITITAFLPCGADNLTEMQKAAETLEDVASDLKSSGVEDLQVITKFMRMRGKAAQLDIEDAIGKAAE